MSDNTTVVRNATCTRCGCLCDDMDLSVAHGAQRITRAGNACELGRAWFAGQGVHDHPAARVGGQPASVGTAVEAAAQILVAARFPIIYGLGDTTCEAQCEAVALADRLRANIDTTAAVHHSSSTLAFQHVGDSTATLGEVKNRADLVIYWGSNPAETHPRHFSRYAVTATGRDTPRGKPDRTVVLVDVRTTASTPVADLFIQVKPGADFELLWALRALVQGKPIDAAIETRTGVSLATLTALVERMKNCRYGVLFFGTGLTMTRGRHFNAGALLALAIDLNYHTHFVAMPMRAPGNVAGAEQVLTWQTGFPFGVNFNRGYPRFSPGEFTTVEVLARGEADAALIIASDPATDFPGEARAHLGTIPVIAIDRKPTPTTDLARVAFTTATYGIHTGGTVYRADGVPLTLRKAFDSPLPSAEDVLKAIHARVRVLGAG